MSLTKSQEAYMDQKTRQLLVGWCDGSLTHITGPGETVSIPNTQDIYRVHAESKKWLSARDHAGMSRVLSAGWETAARFLKR